MKTWIRWAVITCCAVGAGLLTQWHPAGALSPDETPVCGVLSEDTHWSLAGSPYHATCSVEVADGVTLTVDPGVTVRFDSGTELAVRGSLQAAGTADQPVTFTSAAATPAPGDWKRLWFTGAHGASTVAYAVIEYAGQYGYSGVHAEVGSLFVTQSTVRHSAGPGVSASTALAVSGSEISNNLGAGVSFVAVYDGPAVTITNNTLADNGEAAASIRSDPGSVVSLEVAGNTGSGNGLNAILLDAELVTSTLSSNTGLPYVAHALDTLPGTTLTINAGAIIKADQEMSNPGSKILIHGSLLVLGQSGSPVVFTSLRDDSYGGDTNNDGSATRPAPGDWRGLVAYGSVGDHYTAYLPLLLRRATAGRAAPAASPVDRPAPAAAVRAAPSRLDVNARLEHALFRYAGYDLANVELFGGRAQVASVISEYSANKGLYAEDTALEVTGSAFRDNADTGLRLYGKSVPIGPILLNNQFSDNGTRGAYLIFEHDCRSEMNIRANSATGNGQVNGIYVEGNIHNSAGCVLGANAQAPYVVWSIDVFPTGRLVIEPGTVLKFVEPDLQPGTGTTLISGTLEAVGTSNAPIIMTSFWDDSAGGDTDGSPSAGQPGDWIGLLVQPGGQTTLSFAAVRYAGASGSSLSVTDSSLAMTNSVISNSAGKGLSVTASQPGIPLVLRSNMFNANADYAVWLRTSGQAQAQIDASGNSGSGNGINGILLDATLGTTSLGHNTLLPYVVYSVKVAQNAVVTVEPGVTFKGHQAFSGGGSLFAVNGELEVQGTEGAQVTFTSLYDDQVAGDTLGDGAGTQPAPGDWRGINVAAGGEVDLDQCVVRYAGSDDTALYVDGGEASVEHCAISQNVGNGIANMGEAGVLTVTHSVISYNSAAGIVNNGRAYVRYSDIMHNTEWGLKSNTAPWVFIVPAEDNYWGAADGPDWDHVHYCDPEPAGSGDLVSCWNVDWLPFATTPYH